MKKILVLVLAFGLLFGALSTAEAGKKKKKKPSKPRVVTDEYTIPTLGAQPVAGGCYGAIEGGGECYEVKTTAKEKYIKVTFKDSSGLNVAGFIGQGDLNGNGISDDGYAPFCGGHPTSQGIAAPGTPILIYASGGACADGSPAAMTTGSVKIELSSKPF